jgi:hypothetical protein
LEETRGDERQVRMELLRSRPPKSRGRWAIVWVAAAAATVAGLTLALVLAEYERALYSDGAAALGQATTRPTFTGNFGGGVGEPVERSAGAPPPVAQPARPAALGIEIDRVIEALPRANVAFNAPSTLRLDEPAVIQLLLSGRRSIRQLKEQITALGRREGARIVATDLMEAHLVGSGFKIEAITPTVQPASGAGATEWKWEVEPTKAGTRRLYLTLSALLELEGKQSVYTVRTFERRLDVRVPLRERLSGFAGRNWQWLWTALLLPVGARMLRQRRNPGSA